MSTSQHAPLFIHIGTINFGPASPEPVTVANIVRHAASVDLSAAPAEYSEWEKRVWRRGFEAAAANATAAPQREYQQLGGGERITQTDALAELAKLGEGWRLETPHELFGFVDYGHKNQHGAYTRDDSLKEGAYWTSQETPWCRGGRVVVSFGFGLVYDYLDYARAFARAVRVSGQ